MKKMLILISATLIGFGAQAQKKKGEIGLLAGLVTNNVNTSGTLAPNFDKSNAVGGAFYFNSRLVGNFISLRTELGYYPKGGTRYNNLNQPVEQDLQYIAAPALMLQVKLAMLKAYAGPQLSWMISAKEKTGNAVTDVQNSFKKSEWSGVMGAEINLPLRLLAGIRYSFGITDIRDASTITNNYNAKNGTFMLYAGIRLRK
jgi:Outer membrane protein beta-barrel domain